MKSGKWLEQFFFRFSGILRDNDNNSPICNASSEENGMELANILSEWLIIPRKGGRGKDPGELRNKTFPGEACSVPPTHLPPRSVRLGRSFRKSVSIYPTSALRDLNQGPLVMVQCQENLWILNFFSLVSPNRCSSALKESFYNLQYSECKENLKF